MPKLSILLPTYNGEQFLAEQLDSLLAQSDGDFEVLAIDDGSSDGTVALLEAYVARDPRVTLLPSQGNAGQNARLAELLGHARGDYVAVADQDDRWAADRNARMFASIGDRPCVLGTSALMDGDGEPLGKTILEWMGVTFAESDRLSSLVQSLFSAHAMIVRRDFIAREAFHHVLPFDWLIALDAQFSAGLAYCPEAVVHHRLHGGNQSNNFRSAGPRGRFTRSSLGYLLLFRTPDRLRLAQVFDYLGRSTRISPDLRKRFAGLARRCHTVWFSEWRALRSHTPALRDEILDTLAPEAGSEADRARFARHVAMLTAPSLGRPVVAEVRRRYRRLGES